jgi:hypothetical protein
MSCTAWPKDGIPTADIGCSRGDAIGLLYASRAGGHADRTAWTALHEPLSSARIERCWAAYGVGESPGAGYPRGPGLGSIACCGVGRLQPLPWHTHDGNAEKRLQVVFTGVATFGHRDRASGPDLCLENPRGKNRLPSILMERWPRAGSHCSRRCSKRSATCSVSHTSQ